MSDFSLRFYPPTATPLISHADLLDRLRTDRLLSELTEHWGGAPAFRAGPTLPDQIGYTPDLPLAAEDLDGIILTVEHTAGVSTYPPGAAEPEYPVRPLVVSIWGVDGSVEYFQKLVDYLTNITGVASRADWDLL